MNIIRHISLFIRVALAIILRSGRAQCLIEDPTVVGQEIGTPFSNRDEIEALDGYIFHSFETCENDSGDMIGMQYSLVSKTDETDIVPLSSIGEMRGSCRSFELEGPLDMIKASYSLDDGVVNAVEHFKNGNSVSAGILLSQFGTW